MRKKVFALATVGILAAGAATAQSSTDKLVSDFQALGYTHIQVNDGISQVKVEAIKGLQKLEIVYDKQTGAVLKREVKAVGSDDNSTPGVEVDHHSNDFVGNDDSRDGDSQSDGYDNNDDHGSSDQNDDNRDDDKNDNHNDDKNDNHDNDHNGDKKGHDKHDD